MDTAAPRLDPRIVLGAGVLGGLLGIALAQSRLIAIACIIGAVGFTVVLTRPDLVLLAMMMALPWENKLHYPSASLSTVKGIGAAVMLAYVVSLITRRDRAIHLPLSIGITTALGIWVGISLIFSAHPSEGTQKLIRWGLFLIFFFLIVQLIEDRGQVVRAIRCFTASVGAAAIYALWLFLGGHSGFRASGPLEDPNDFGYLLACTTPLAAYLVAKDRGYRLIWSVTFMFIVGAMLATLSRGALVGIGTLFVWGIATRRVPVWAIFAGLGISLVVVGLAFTLWKPLVDEALHQKEHIAQNNTESREALWVAALELAERHPLAGVGPELFPRDSLPLLRNDPINLARSNVKRSVAHNSYLEILAENGAPALLLFLAYLATTWFLLRQTQLRARLAGDIDGRRLTTALQAGILIAIVSGTFLSEELSAPFWLLGGLAVVLARQSPQEPASASDKSRRTPLALPTSTT
jgi:putative inorganic carbon (HCO3(-)) transporter